MKTSIKAFLAAAVLFHTQTYAQEPLVGLGSEAYPDPFSPDAEVTAAAPSGSGLVINPAQVSGTFDRWSLTAGGGASYSAFPFGDSTSVAQTEVADSVLRFSVVNTGSPVDLYDNVSEGQPVPFTWAARTTFDAPEMVLSLAPHTAYTVVFHVEHFESLTGTPVLNFSFLDGAGNPVLANDGSSVIDLLGVVAETGDVQVTFTTGSEVAPGAFGLEFTGSFNADSTNGAALSNNGASPGRFATFYDLAIFANPVPEPSSLLLLCGAGLAFLSSRRRPAREQA